MDNRVRVFRAENGWTQADLANRVGVSRQAIYAVEAGRHDPSLRLAFKLAHVFDCMVEQLFEPDAALYEEIAGRPASESDRRLGRRCDDGR